MVSVTSLTDTNYLLFLMDRFCIFIAIVGEKSKVIIPAGLLVPGTNYTLSLESVDGAVNSLHLAVTDIPNGGNCSISPTVGESSTHTM